MRVLIVEDEAIVALDLEFLVETMGHEVCGWAARVDDAVRISRETKPDLVLMDVRLADGGCGLDAARAISAELTVRVVFVTGNADVVETAALPFRPAGVIPKPLTEPALRRAMAN
jgi:CheY-like chemotaxis protein